MRFILFLHESHLIIVLNASIKLIILSRINLIKNKNSFVTLRVLLMPMMFFTFQYKVYEEIYQVFGDGDEIITTEKTSKLVYMEQVIKETLRLYPSIPLFLRHLQDDVKICE